MSNKWDWIRRLAGFYGEESTAIRHSHAVFRSCYDVGSQPHILQHLVLENDFFHNHALINLHAWLVHNRLRSVGSQGKVMQEQLFDRFWEDTTTRIRTLGVPELTVNKHLKETQTFSFGAAMAYDHGLKESKDVLAGALYRNVFSNHQERPDLEESVIQMAGYVQDQVACLANQHNDDVMVGTLSWNSTPGQPKGQVNSRKSSGEDEWKEAVSDNGDVYYWNQRTRETKWRK